MSFDYAAPAELFLSKQAKNSHIKITSSSFPLSPALNARSERRCLYIAAEVRELLRVLFIRFCSVPANSGRTTSTQLRSISRRGLEPIKRSVANRRAI